MTRTPQVIAKKLKATAVLAARRGVRTKERGGDA